MDKKKVISKLNDILRWEWTGLAQYAQAGFVVSGVWREVYSEFFFESAKECFKHARIIGEKIAAMGGVPTVERDKIQQSSDLMEMLHTAHAFESAAVEHYRQALKLCEDDRPLVVLLEDLILQEQEGVDHLEKILREQGTAAKTGGAAKAG